MGDRAVFQSQREQILRAITEKTEKSGGHGVYTAVKLAYDLNIELNTVKQVLNQLYPEKKIIVSPTIHGLGARLRELV